MLGGPWRLAVQSRRWRASRRSALDGTSIELPAALIRIGAVWHPRSSPTNMDPSKDR